MKKLLLAMTLFTVFALSACGYEESLEGCILETFEDPDSGCTRGEYIETYITETLEQESIFYSLDGVTLSGHIGAIDAEKDDYYDVSVYASLYSSSGELSTSDIRKIQELYDFMLEDLNDNEVDAEVYLLLSLYYTDGTNSSEVLFHPEEGELFITIALKGTGDFTSFLQSNYREMEKYNAVFEEEIEYRINIEEDEDYTLVITFLEEAYVSSEVETDLSGSEVTEHINDILDTVTTIFGE